jgi:hypothetical protein
VNEDWSSALKKASVSAFVGFHNSVYTSYANSLLEEFMFTLIEGKTVDTALSTAISKYGKNDEIWWGHSVADHLPAYPLLRGDKKALLQGNLSREDGSGNDKKKEQVPDWEVVYAEVLNQYRELATMSNDERDDFFASEGGMQYNNLFFQYEPGAKPDIKFALFDMDGDGKPELIFGDGNLPQYGSDGEFIQSASPMDIWVLDDENKPVFAYRNEMISAIYGFNMIESDGKYLAYSHGGDEGWTSTRFVSVHSGSITKDVGFIEQANIAFCDMDAFEFVPEWNQDWSEVISATYRHNDKAVSHNQYITALEKYLPAISIDDSYGDARRIILQNPIALEWSNLTKSSDSKKENSMAEPSGSISITNVSPQSAVKGVETTFTITVEYTSKNTDGCIIYAGANINESDRFALLDEHILDDVSGTYTFNITCIPTTWQDNDFGIYVNISEYPHPDSWNPFGSDVYYLRL